MKTVYLFLKILLVLCIFDVSNLQASEEKSVDKNSMVFGKKLTVGELQTLNEIRSLIFKPNSDAFSSEKLEWAIYQAADHLFQDEFRIFEFNLRNRDCQLTAWFASEVLKEKEELSLDHLLIRIFLVDADLLDKKFRNEKLFETTLISLGLLKEKELNSTPLTRLYNLLDAWLQFRIIARLVGEEDAPHYLGRETELDMKKGGKIVTAGTLDKRYKIQHSEKLMEILFKRAFRSKTLLIAYHDGIPSRTNGMCFNTVKYFFVLKFNERKGRWEIQSSVEDLSKEFKVFYSNSFKTYVKTTLPEENEDYIVVHLGHASNSIQKWIDKSFISAVGLDRIDFEASFLRFDNTDESIAKKIPGHASIFHLNYISKFSEKFFIEYVKTYSRPHDIGFFWDNRYDRDPCEKSGDQPFSITVHKGKPMAYGKCQRPGVSVSYAVGDNRFLLRVFYGVNHSIDLKDSYFVKTILVKENKEGDYERLVYAPATENDWKQFLELFFFYVKSGYAPRIGNYIEETLGLNEQTLEDWKKFGSQLIGKESAGKYDFVESPLPKGAYLYPTSVGKVSMRGKIKKIVFGPDLEDGSCLAHITFDDTSMKYAETPLLKVTNSQDGIRMSELGNIPDRKFIVVPHKLTIRYLDGSEPTVIKFENPFSKQIANAPKLHRRNLGKVKNHSPGLSGQMGFVEDEELQQQFRQMVGGIQDLWVNGVHTKIRVRPVPGDGDCGMAVLGLTRQQFINAVIRAYHLNQDAELKRWIEEAFLEARVGNIADWARRFSSSGYWMTTVHFRIASRIFNLIIHVLAIATNPLELPEELQDRNVFVGVQGEEGLIDASINPYTATHIHLANVPLTFGGEIIHYDRVLIGDEVFQEDISQQYDIPVRKNDEFTALESDWIRELTRNPFLWTSTHIPARILFLFLTGLIVSPNL